MKQGIFGLVRSKLYETHILKKPVTRALEENRDIIPPLQASRSAVFIAKVLGTGGGVGYAPFAQGTFGSLWAPVLYLIAPASLFAGRFHEVSLIVTGAAIVLYFLGVWSARICESLWGHDPGRVVIDEVAGVLTTLVFIPLTMKTVWMGFFLFRLFDIFKPPPVRWSEKLPHGWGVMSDDVIAGIYANISVRIILHFWGV